MKGFPRVLNSKEDYQNVVNDFGCIEKVKKAYQGLLNTAEHYVFDRELGTDESPDGQEPEYKVMEEKQEDGSITRNQYKLVENPNGRIFKLGFTKMEIQEVIDKC